MHSGVKYAAMKCDGKVAHTIRLTECVCDQAYLERYNDIHDTFNYQTERNPHIQKLQAGLA